MFCPKCGKSFAQGENHCRNCGYSLEEAKDIVVDSPAPITYPTNRTVFAAPPVKKPNKKLMSIGIIVLSFVVIGTVVISQLVRYFNSDDYKLGKAEEEILADWNDDNDGVDVYYGQAISNIEGVGSSRADALRQLVEVLTCRQNYIESYDRNDMYYSSDAEIYYDGTVTIDAADYFMNAVDEFNNNGYSEYLSDELYDIYSECAAAVDMAQDFMDNTGFYSDVYDMQVEIYDYYIRKSTGERFTSDELLEDITDGRTAFNSAYANIESGDEKFWGSGDLESPDGYCYAVEELYMLLAYSEARIESDDDMLESQMESDDYEYSDWYFTDVDEDYTPDDILELPITDYDNISENADGLTRSIQYGLLAYYLGVDVEE